MVQFNSSRETACTACRAYLGNDTTCANSAAVANAHTWQDNHIARNPTVLADGNLAAEFRSVGAIAQIGIDWVRAAEEADVGANQGAGANSDNASVNDGAVEVDEDVASNAYVVAVVDSYRPFDPGIVVQHGILFLGRRGWRWELLFIVGDAVSHHNHKLQESNKTDH